MPSASDYTFDQLYEGLAAEHEYVIDDNTYRSFLALFGDVSLVHTSQNFANTSGFTGLVMHGAILNGFLSHFIGMCLPGQRSLELTVDIRYLKPCYLGEHLRLRGEVKQKLDSRRVAVLDVSWDSLMQQLTVARARVQVAMLG